MPPGRAMAMSECESIRSFRSERLSHGNNTSICSDTRPVCSRARGTMPMVVPPHSWTASPMQPISPQLPPPHTKVWRLAAIHSPSRRVAMKYLSAILSLAEQYTAMFISFIIYVSGCALCVMPRQRGGGEGADYFFFFFRRAHPSSEKSGSSPLRSIFFAVMRALQSSAENSRWRSLRPLPRCCLDFLTSRRSRHGAA